MLLRDMPWSPRGEIYYNGNLTIYKPLKGSMEVMCGDAAYAIVVSYRMGNDMESLT